MDRTTRLMIENSTFGACSTIDNFLKLVSLDTEPRKRLLEKMQWRQDNRYWLNKSASITVKILRKLSDLKMSKADLALASNISIERMNEIVKGSADLTLSEITKIELILKIIL